MKNTLKNVMLPLASRNDTITMRSFALTMSIVFPFVFTLFLPWLFNHGLAYWPLAVSSVLMTLYVLYPKGIFYPYYVWMIIASILGWLNTRLILGLVFYIVITPIGLMMKTLGKLQYKKQVHDESNWVKQTHTDARKDKKRLEEPF